jgi:hypothetical protein
MGKMVVDGCNDPSLATKVSDVTLRGIHLLGEYTHLVENLATKSNHDNHTRGMPKGKALVP